MAPAPTSNPKDSIEKNLAILDMASLPWTKKFLDVAKGMSKENAWLATKPP